MFDWATIDHLFDLNAATAIVTKPESTAKDRADVLFLPNDDARLDAGNRRRDFRLVDEVRQ